MKTILTAVVVLLSSIVLSGCVTMPKPLSGEFASIKPADVANNPAVTGRQVRWGGSILKTYSDNGRSCMEILGQALDDKIAKPVDPDLSNGRFVACKDNFLDPAIFAPGREVTVTGRIERIDDTAINDFDYQYAVLITDVLFLWPEDSSGYYAGSKYEQGNGYYVARYRQPSYYPYGYFGGYYSPFYYPYHFGGFGHGFYGFHGFRGFHGGYFGGFRGGFGHRGTSPRYTQPRQRQARQSSRAGGFRAASPAAVSTRGSSAGRSAAGVSGRGSTTRRQ